MESRRSANAYKFLISSFVAALLLAQVASASTGVNLTTGMLKDMASLTAVAYNIDPPTFLSIIECESGWDEDIQSNYVHKGKRENSWGLTQINLDVWKDVTREQAKSAMFNLNWAAQHFDDAPHLWYTCYKEATKDIHRTILI